MTLRLDDFAGDWRVLRRIADRRSGQDGLFNGTARLIRQGGGLIYREDGHLTLASGQPLRATRSYRWHQAGGRIVVDHGDGRPFHDFDPADPVVCHLCGADTYAGRYDFADWPDWQVTWDVTGPAKDYHMVSRYSRALAKDG